ncbi:hypothetical protein B566_EDAN006774, partial [Ephemera danica]
MVTQFFIILMLVLQFISISTNSLPVTEDREFWYLNANKRIHEALTRRENLNIARNVIVFVGDGMGMSTITAARIYHGQRQGFTGEEGFLSWDNFPTYEVIGFDATVKHKICDPEDLKRAKLDSILTWAQSSGKDTGIVTTTRLTHATPAALFAHTQYREWECDSEIPNEYTDCVKDIGRQLVEDEPGKNIKVLFGGGLHQLGVEVDPKDDSCRRKDGRNLVEEWSMDKIKRGLHPNFVRNTEEMMALKPSQNQYVLGVFSGGHTSYEAERDTDAKGSPSLVNMTVKAIQLLRENPNGFFLMVEGGRIDHAHHYNYARLAMMETEQLDAAVAAALEITGHTDTLILVTADHSHAMTFAGYNKRGHDILGIGVNTESDGLPTETLTYANGPSFYYHRKQGTITAGESLWQDITQMDRKALRYRHFAPKYHELATHTGEDVPVYAI